MKRTFILLILVIILITACAPTAANSAPAQGQTPVLSNQPKIQTEVSPIAGQPVVTPTQPGAASMATTSQFYAEENLVLIPAGSFEMGDHFNYVDPAHPGSDEIPLHTLQLASFYMAINATTNQQYAEFLNSALSQGLIEVHDGNVSGARGNTLYFTTRQADEFSPIAWDGTNLAVLDNRQNHPVTSVRWEGAAAYTNWLSVKNGYSGCYDPTTWKCDISSSGYRLPTEAEWEYAARGGQSNPYYNFPWGNEPDNTKANWPGSGDPYEAGPYPWTTPAGFYNGKLHQKSEFNWPGPQQTYQTSDAANGYGLYDMAGNVWQWVNDWYGRDYYRTSPSVNPPGPESGSPMPDGKPYHVMRGGNWYNGEWGHSRVSNRDPGYFRGPQDPNHPYYHVGFRVVLKK